MQDTANDGTQQIAAVLVDGRTANITWHAAADIDLLSFHRARDRSSGIPIRVGRRLLNGTGAGDGPYHMAKAVRCSGERVFSGVGWEALPHGDCRQDRFRIWVRSPLVFIETLAENKLCWPRFSAVLTYASRSYQHIEGGRAAAAVEPAREYIGGGGRTCLAMPLVQIPTFSSSNEPNFGTDILVIQLLGGSFIEGRNENYANWGSCRYSKSYLVSVDLTFSVLLTG